MSRICLNMIVRNESAILERCLASVAPWIDHYVVCDTGSTDGTPELVESFFKELEIPGKVEQFEFENFGQARNEALSRARASSAEFDYLLLADADMELVVEDVAFKERLRAPGYMVKQVCGISYDNVRFVRRDVPAKYLGVTHEYLSLDGAQSRLEGLWFIDHAEGSSRSEKSERDACLLEEGLRKEPRNVRYMFYLAQTYKDMGRFSDALEWYRKRVKHGSAWEEEAWYASYMMALCYRELGDAEKFTHQVFVSYEMRPTRAEPLQLLATYLREKGSNHGAMLICNTALNIPKPVDSLFVEDFVYSEGIKQEISIAGFYSPRESDRDLSRKICFELASRANVFNDVRSLAARNSCHQARLLSEMVSDVKICSLSVDDIPAGYHAMNPSIVSVLDKDLRHNVVGELRYSEHSVAGDRQRLLCNVRMVNYQFDPVDGRTYRTSDADGVIRTKNRVVTLDPSTFAVIGSKDIFDADPSERTNFPVEGYEDVRIFQWQDRLWASATVRDRTTRDGDGACRIALLEMEETNLKYIVRRTHVLETGLPPDSGTHQKNWMPLVRGKHLSFIHRTLPMTILDIDPERFDITNVRSLNQHSRFHIDDLRGSSQVIAFEGGYLCVTHEAFDVGTRRYTHRFVELDENLCVSRLSDPFYFVHKGVEFALGLAVNPAHKDELIVSLGVNDAAPMLVALHRETVIQLLEEGPHGSS